MASDLNILILEDNESDADLLRRELKKSGLSFTSQIVQTRIEFEYALQNFLPDLILSDYSLPSFDAGTAFRIKQNKDPNIPFIIVSGVIGDENAVELIKEGVTDYVSKDKLFTLSTKINRALNDTAVRKEKENRTADLIILSENLKIQKRELRRANKMLIWEEEKVKIINRELSELNQELEVRVVKRTKALAESESRFRNMMETIPQIAWTNTVEGEVVFYNQRWYDYTGLDDRQTKLLGYNQVIHPEDLRVSFYHFRSILKTGSGGEFQVRAKRGDGLYRWHLLRLMPIMDEQGEMQLWVGTATDIQQLRILQQQKDDFISIASHELKTPITTLKASLQLLDRIKNNPTSTMLPKLIEQANKSLGKVNTLIEDLLNASLANEGQLHINQQKFVLAEVIEECRLNLPVEDQLCIKTEGDMTVQVYADPIRIGQVLINFLNNAIKYAPRSKEIKINIEKSNQTVKVSVIDKGPGIQPEKLPYIFDRYYRVDSNGSQYTGLGLGLYICGEIIKKHMGKIGVDSEVDKGSAFWFTLPVVITD
jgi:PAS domain S-box-containing protein